MDPAEENPAATPAEKSGAGRRRGVLPALSAVVLVAGLAVLGVFGWRYLDARDAQDHAHQRDAAVDVASRVLVDAYSFDHDHVDESLARLADESTGDFREQQKQWAPQVRQRVLDQKAVTRASVSNAATEALDLDKGTATVLLVFTAESRRENMPNVTGRQAAKIDLARENGTWKVSALTPIGVVVPVGDSSAAVRGLGDPTTTPNAGPSSSAPSSSVSSSPTSSPSSPAPSSAPSSPAPSSPPAPTTGR